MSRLVGASARRSGWPAHAQLSLCLLLLGAAMGCAGAPTPAAGAAEPATPGEASRVAPPIDLLAYAPENARVFALFDLRSIRRSPYYEPIATWLSETASLEDDELVWIERLVAGIDRVLITGVGGDEDDVLVVAQTQLESDDGVLANAGFLPQRIADRDVFVQQSSPESLTVPAEVEERLLLAPLGQGAFLLGDEPVVLRQLLRGSPARRPAALESPRSRRVFEGLGVERSDIGLVYLFDSDSSPLPPELAPLVSRQSLPELMVARVGLQGGLNIAIDAFYPDSTGPRAAHGELSGVLEQARPLLAVMGFDHAAQSLRIGAVGQTLSASLDFSHAEVLRMLQMLAAVPGLLEGASLGAPPGAPGPTP
ncbi:MAG: hypothetical protein OEY14_18875 [Myxococcales bacterium]|nr:hypothetical protein [Myxococcales bacterium]